MRLKASCWLKCLVLARLLLGGTAHAADSTNPDSPTTGAELPGWPQLERVVDTALSACRTDLEAFCATITAGEGREMACLIAHRDQVAQSCESALGPLELRGVTLRQNPVMSYPTLEERGLGEPYRDPEGQVVLWNRTLPFLAQTVIDLGFDLPKPYGVAVIPAWIQQDLVLEDLAIAINDGPVRKIDFVDFGSPEVENGALQIKFDAWVLPFLNVYTTVGKFDGEATIPLEIEGPDLFPDLCSVTPNLPPCVRTYGAIATPEYEGNNVAFGVNLAMGWDRFFVTLPITRVWTDVDILDTTVTGLNVSPRFGILGDLGRWGVIAPFVGINYLSAEVDIEGRVTFDTPDGPSGPETTVDFQVNQRNKDKINYLLGFNWEFNKTWSVTAEAGIGGSRQSFIGAITYRF